MKGPTHSDVTCHRVHGRVPGPTPEVPPVLPVVVPPTPHEVPQPPDEVPRAPIETPRPAPPDVPERGPADADPGVAGTIPVFTREPRGSS